MSTKKVYAELVAYLESNKDKKVADVLSSNEFKELITAKKNHSTVLKNDKDQVVAIYCYYHKQWELLSEVEYGKKSSSPSGYNTMCKVGVNKWTKQHNDAKREKAELLEMVAEGKVKPEDIQARISEIDKRRDRIDQKDMPKGTKQEPKVA